MVVPSVDVTKGEVRPTGDAVHPLVIVGGFVAVILVTVKLPVERAAMKVPWLVR